jgi:hypothetical protein
MWLSLDERLRLEQGPVDAILVCDVSIDGGWLGEKGEESEEHRRLGLRSKVMSGQRCNQLVFGDKVMSGQRCNQLVFGDIAFES